MAPPVRGLLLPRLGPEQPPAARPPRSHIEATANQRGQVMRVRSPLHVRASQKQIAGLPILVELASSTRGGRAAARPSRRHLPGGGADGAGGAGAGPGGPGEGGSSREGGVAAMRRGGAVSCPTFPQSRPGPPRNARTLCYWWHCLIAWASDRCRLSSSCHGLILILNPSMPRPVLASVPSVLQAVSPVSMFSSGSWPSASDVRGTPSAVSVVPVSHRCALVIQPGVPRPVHLARTVLDHPSVRVLSSQPIRPLASPIAVTRIPVLSSASRQSLVSLPLQRVALSKQRQGFMAVC